MFLKIYNNSFYNFVKNRSDEKETRILQNSGHAKQETAIKRRTMPKKFFICGPLLLYR